MRLEMIPEPTLAEDEVLIRVAACGLCGSDLEYYYGTVPLLTPSGEGPLVLGHEVCGEIVEVGSLARAQDLRPGMRVAVNPIQNCGSCDYCRNGEPEFCPRFVTLGVSSNGGFAEYTKTKYWQAYELPDSVSDEEGAFVEMLASAVNAVRMLEVGAEDYVVVFGPGPVGLAIVELLRMEGARVALVGTRDYRLELGREVGAECVFNVSRLASPYYVDDLASAVKDVNRGRLADGAIVGTGSSKATADALDVSGPGSVIVCMGLAAPEERVELPLLSSLYQAKTIRFAWQYPFQWPRTIRILEKGRISTEKIITHVVPLESIMGAIDRTVNRDDKVVKTVIKP